MEYEIELTEKQTQIIQEALNLYFRLHLGQWQELANMVRTGWYFRHKNGKETSMPLWGAVEKLIDTLIWIVFGFRPGESWGIRNKNVPDSARIACDIHDVIRHQLWYDRTTGQGHGVDSDEPYSISGDPLPTIRRVAE